MNVSEFSNRTGLSPHTIRYYDKIGLLDDVQRRANGHRSFTEKDLSWLAFVKRLKDTGMPLANIQKYAQLRKAGQSTLQARQKLLIDHADALGQRIADQQTHLKNLENKIAFYQAEINHTNPID
ncbi:putative HTH-type transcriptional regulator [Zhongshania aliphaticivorans]|uniref:Putative HTH-type transcriptional regulator n=1 Tax=Zhongshania aliphaticivorans TaxID=1470434 RepID=A0A5S9PJ00_9GAMM|nr:MerR family transcriptional regulator [Zhongshania aliphaticivorans]CAA0104024.1 putative HTH-type transcriptional regulator [Zhongshania aliphaticivorans]CAA0104196.1 putative HTH-type transcriptional regulator [Zhongshania aliphaticivorans]